MFCESLFLFYWGLLRTWFTCLPLKHIIITAIRPSLRFCLTRSDACPARCQKKRPFRAPSPSGGWKENRMHVTLPHPYPDVLMFNKDSSQHFSQRTNEAYWILTGNFPQADTCEQISLKTHQNLYNSLWTGRKTPGVMQGMCVRDSLLTLCYVWHGSYSGREKRSVCFECVCVCFECLCDGVESSRVSLTHTHTLAAKSIGETFLATQKKRLTSVCWTVWAPNHTQTSDCHH